MWYLDVRFSELFNFTSFVVEMFQQTDRLASEWIALMPKSLCVHSLTESAKADAMQCHSKVYAGPTHI